MATVAYCFSSRGLSQKYAGGGCPTRTNRPHECQSCWWRTKPDPNVMHVDEPQSRLASPHCVPVFASRRATKGIFGIAPETFLQNINLQLYQRLHVWTFVHPGCGITSHHSPSWVHRVVHMLHSSWKTQAKHRICRSPVYFRPPAAQE